MAETREQRIENSLVKIFDAIDHYGPAMQQRMIREALEDLDTVAHTAGYYEGYDYGIQYGGPIG